MMLKIKNDTNRKLNFDRYYNISQKYNIDLKLYLKLTKKGNFNFIERGKAEYVDTRGMVLNKLNINSSKDVPKITLFISSWETEESIYWIFLHELAHLLMCKNKILCPVLEEYSTRLEEILKKFENQRIYEDCYDYLPVEIYASTFAILNSGAFYGREWVIAQLSKSKKHKKLKEKRKISKLG